MSAYDLRIGGFKGKNLGFEKLQAMRELHQERANMVAARKNSLSPSMFGFGFNGMGNNGFACTTGFQA